MKRAGVLPERRGFKSVCDGSGRTPVVKADIRNPLRYSGQSGYSQSALLLAHNRVKQVPTHCLLLHAIEAGDLLDSVKKQAACDSKNRGRPLWLSGR